MPLEPWPPTAASFLAAASAASLKWASNVQCYPDQATAPESGSRTNDNAGSSGNAPWRAGGEARISRLKNTFGMRRSPYRGRTGVDRCIGWAAIANNLVAIGRYRVERPSP